MKILDMISPIHILRGQVVHNEYINLVICSVI